MRRTMRRTHSRWRYGPSAPRTDVRAGSSGPSTTRRGSAGTTTGAAGSAADRRVRRDGIRIGRPPGSGPGTDRGAGASVGSVRRTGRTGAGRRPTRNDHATTVFSQMDSLVDPKATTSPGGGATSSGTARRCRRRRCRRLTGPAPPLAGRMAGAMTIAGATPPPAVVVESEDRPGVRQHERGAELAVGVERGVGRAQDLGRRDVGLGDERVDVAEHVRRRALERAGVADGRPASPARSRTR